MSITVTYFTDAEITEQIKRGETPHEKDVCADDFLSGLDKLSESERKRMGLVIPAKTLKPENNLPFSDKEVAEAALKKDIAHKIEQLECWKDNSSDEHLVFAHDVLMEQISGVTQNLCFDKQCPFVNECINDILEAVHFELEQGKHYDLACSPYPMIETLQKAKKLVS